MSTNGGACRDMIAATHPMPGTDPKPTFAQISAPAGMQRLQSFPPELEVLKTLHSSAPSV